MMSLRAMTSSRIDWRCNVSRGTWKIMREDRIINLVLFGSPVFLTGSYRKEEGMGWITE